MTQDEEKFVFRIGGDPQKAKINLIGVIENIFRNYAITNSSVGGVEKERDFFQSSRKTKTLPPFMGYEFKEGDEIELFTKNKMRKKYDFNTIDIGEGTYWYGLFLYDRFRFRTVGCGLGVNELVLFLQKDWDRVELFLIMKFLMHLEKPKSMWALFESDSDRTWIGTFSKRKIKINLLNELTKETFKSIFEERLDAFYYSKADSSEGYDKNSNLLGLEFRFGKSTKEWLNQTQLERLLMIITENEKKA